MSLGVKSTRIEFKLKTNLPINKNDLIVFKKKSGNFPFIILSKKFFSKANINSQ